MKKGIPPVERILARITLGEDFDGRGPCWLLLTGSRRDYARIWVKRRSEPAHRVVYEALVGAIPEGCDVHHECEQKRCVNPEHLATMTEREHMLLHDSAAAQAARRTHCPRGHPLVSGNLVLTQLRRGKRVCLTCQHTHHAAWEKRNREKRNAYRRRRRAAKIAVSPT